jgi:hypothetical protein
MHYYLDQALSEMRSHLLDPVAHQLPESQVVAARADNKPWNKGDDSYKNDLPDIALELAPAQCIEFRNATVEIPDG